MIITISLKTQSVDLVVTKGEITIQTSQEDVCAED